MAAFHIILWDNTAILHSLLCEEVCRDGFLQERITDVFLVPQHRGFDTSTSLHPHPINEGVKRGEGGEA